MYDKELGGGDSAKWDSVIEGDGGDSHMNSGNIKFHVEFSKRVNELSEVVVMIEVESWMVVNIDIPSDPNPAIYDIYWEWRLSAKTMTRILCKFEIPHKFSLTGRVKKRCEVKKSSFGHLF